jgi:IclR family mhp operon transcriptional activator
LPSYKPVEAVVRAIDLLAELNRHKVCSVATLHKATGLPKPTIVRLLETLMERGYVVNDARQGGYQVTSLVQSLSCGFHGDPLVIEAGRAWLIEFTRRHKWPVSIALLDHDAVMVRFSTIPDSPVSPFHATINMRLRLLTRALGRAYLAFCPPDERDFIVDILARSNHPEDQQAKSRKEVLRTLASIRAVGFASRPARVEPLNSSTIAVPIVRGEQVLATVGMTYFRSALPGTQVIDRFVQPIQQLAANVVKTVVQLERQKARR